MAEVNHGERAHALLSASGASRWLACPPSARLEEQFPEKASSVYAEEGTLAHELAELKLTSAYKLAIKEKSTRSETDARRKKIKAIEAHDLFSAEMHEYVDVYVAYCMELFADARKRTPDAVMLIECRVSLQAFIEDGFGTCDCIIIADGVMDVVDLKYGKGLRVYADNNSQLKLYSLGALDEYGFLYDITTARPHIVQPRLDAISSWETDVQDLEAWGHDFVKPRAKEAYAGEGAQVAGDHCQWCRVKVHCRALAELSLASAVNDFPNPALLTDAEILEAYEKSGLMGKWIAALTEYVYVEALAGRKWEGFKLVEGRSNRQLDADKAEAKLRAEGYTDADILNAKLKGLGELEKLLTKSGFEKTLGAFVTKPAGKPTLVPVSDKREEINGVDVFPLLDTEDDFLN